MLIKKVNYQKNKMTKQKRLNVINNLKFQI